MKQFDRFSKGMGIGGWLTNYKRFNVIEPKRRCDITVGDMEHFLSYINEEDIKYIASLGLDHVRLGFDQIVLEESPFVYREEIIGLLVNFVKWCEKYNLRPVLNLHKAVGNYCDILDEAGLMVDESLQDRFVSLWEKLEEVFAKDNFVAFELLNEVVNATADRWNALCDRTIRAIRAKNKERIIIIGGIEWGNPPGLLTLNVYDDENVIYTFHTYQPLEFTHQQGVLCALPLYYNRKLEYPSDDVEKYADYFRTARREASPYDNFSRIDKEYLRHVLSPAIEFMKMHPDKTVWCGEFGTIRHIPVKYRENWMRDLISLLLEYDIPYSVWNYLSTPNDGNKFSLVDDDNRKIVSAEMAKIIVGDI